MSSSPQLCTAAVAGFATACLLVHRARCIMAGRLAIGRANEKDLLRQDPNDRSLTVSAPGKVLITGGYLILEKPHQGLVVSTTSRFYTRIGWRASSNEKSQMCMRSMQIEPNDSTATVFVVVRSPQFGTSTCYEICLPIGDYAASGAPLVSVQAVPFIEDDTIVAPGSHNPYVFTTLQYCFTALHVLKRIDAVETRARLQDGDFLEIILNADNCFYSQQEELARQGVVPSEAAYKALPAFMKPKTISKTGLGSSATLVTSLVGALMAHIGKMYVPSITSQQVSPRKPSPNEQSSINTLHRLAQLCHVVAQGKVGSGFDVSAAVYGSICYERYSPSLLLRFIGSNEEPLTCDDIAVVVSESAKDSKDAAPSSWDHFSEPFGLPDGLEIVLGDIAQGSSTPSMVRRVKAWRKSDKNSGKVWEKLNLANEAVRAGLSKLRDQGVALSTCDNIRKDFLEVREQLRAMGKGAGVDIEPDAQTSLCNATMDLKDVLMCGVPGAGGNDAVFAIYRGGNATRKRIEEFWSEWRRAHRIKLCAMPLRGTPHGEPGLRVEQDKIY